MLIFRSSCRFSAQQQRPVRYRGCPPGKQQLSAFPRFWVRFKTPRKPTSSSLQSPTASARSAQHLTHLLHSSLSLTWPFCCCIFPVRSEHADHVRCSGVQQGRDLVFFAAPWLGADRHGWRERESAVEIKKNNNLDVRCKYHRTAAAGSFLLQGCVRLLQFYTLHLQTLETFYLNVIIFLYHCQTCMHYKLGLLFRFLLYSDRQLWEIQHIS